MLDQLKRLATAATIAAMLGVAASSAPAQAQEPEPAELDPARCATSAPLGDEWELLQTFVPETGSSGQACRDCLAYAEPLRTGGLEYYCWEVNAFEAQLYFRSPPSPSPIPPPPAPPAASRCATPPAGWGWTPGNVFWHWEEGQACENCLAQVASLEEVRRTLPGWIFEPRLYQCWDWWPDTVVLYFRSG